MEKNDVVEYYSGLAATIKSVKTVQKLYDPTVAFNFNSLNFLRPGENKYSELLAFFLNPKSAHGQGTLFLKLFLENVGLYDCVSEFDLNDVDCACEYVIENQRRIDILIRFNADNFVIAVENKIWANDQFRQLEDYNDFLQKRYKNYRLLYLTPYQKEPSEHSIANTSFKELEKQELFKIIGYTDNIIDCVHSWALNCQAERVRVFLLDFEQYLKKEFLGQRFMEENQTIAQYAVGSQEKIEVAFGTFNAMNDLKKILLTQFKAQLAEIAVENSLDKYVVEDLGLNENYTGFYFFKSSWKYANIAFQFNSKNANSLIYGINLKGAGLIGKDEPIEIPELLKNEILEKCSPSKRQEGWWILWENFESEVKDWYNNPQPWLEIQNGKMKKRIDKIVKEFLEKIGDLNL